MKSSAVHADVSMSLADASESACFLSVLVVLVTSFFTSAFSEASSAFSSVLEASVLESSFTVSADASLDVFSSADTFSSFEVSVTSDCTAWAALAVLSCANVGIARENDNANDNTTAKNFFIFMLLASLLLIYVNFIYIHLLPAHEARSHIYCF